LADEIEHGEALVIAGATKAAAELLEINDVALGRPKEKHAVDLRDIDTLVEDIDDEEDVESAVGEVGAVLATGVGVGFGSQALGGDARLLEEPCHESGMFDAHAEPERPHGFAVELAAAVGIGQILAKLVEHELGAQMVGIEKVLQFAFIIFSRVQAYLRVVHGGIADGEVVERAEEFVLQGVGQADLGGGGAIEMRGDAGAIGAFGRGGETEKDARTEEVDDGIVALCLGMVGFVDDDVFPCIRAVDFVQLPVGEGLDGAEDMIHRMRLRPSTSKPPKFPSLRTCRKLPSACSRISLRWAMKRSLGWRPSFRDFVPVVEGGDHRLAGSGGGDDEVAEVLPGCRARRRGLRGFPVGRDAAKDRRR
jgi:hypothetical protein